MSAELIDPAILFASKSGHDGACCECCSDYCPAWDDDTDKILWDEPLIRIVVGDVEYVGNRRAIIRGDILAAFPDDAPFTEIDLRAPEWAVVPDAAPPALPAPRATARYVDRIDRAGLEARTHRGTATHLYRNGEHVGWGTNSTSDYAITPGELEPVRVLAVRLSLDLNDAARAMFVTDELRAQR